MKAYHGSKSEKIFEEFLAESENGTGAWFSTSENVARSYAAEHFYEDEIKPKNLLTLDCGGECWSDLPWFKDWELMSEYANECQSWWSTWTIAAFAKKRGYDCVRFENLRDMGVANIVEGEDTVVLAVLDASIVTIESVD